MWIRRRWATPDPELRFLPSFVKKGDTVIDVGAHRGLYTLILASLVGAEGRVHAFEPQARLAARLQRATGSNVTVHQVALGASEGTGTLFTPRWGWTLMTGHATLSGAEDHESGTSAPVSVRPVDAFGIRPSFMKVDAEHYELELLTGGIQTLRERPVLLIEIDYRHRGQVEWRGNLLQMLDGMGYRPHFAGTDELVPVRLTPDQDPNGWTVHRDEYVYNWFMLPDGPN